MKTKKLIELQRDKLALHNEARALFAKIEATDGAGDSSELEASHDRVMRAIDQVNLNIDEASCDDAGSAQERHSRRPGGSGFASGSDDGSNFAQAWANENRTGWTDSNGNPVRVIGADERISNEEQRGTALGDVVRAMVVGPRSEIEKRALSEGTNSAGGYTVPTPLASWFIDRLRARSAVIKAGALTVSMDSATLAIARLDTDPVIGWRAENAALASGDATFSRVLLTAKSLAGIVLLSRELLMDTVNAGQMIEQAIAKAMALEMDRAAIYGNGSGNSPTGIINISGINEVSMGTNGAQVTSYDKLIDTIYEMQLDNAADPTAGIMHPRTGSTLAKLKDAQLNPLQVPEMVRRVPLLTTTSAPIAETLGTSSDTSSIVFGDFSQLFIGMRHEITIQMLSELYAATGQIGLAVHARMDVQLAHTESFSRLKGIKP